MRSVRRPAQYETIVRRLTETNHPDVNRTVFPTMRDVMCFAAVLGFHVGNKTPIRDLKTEEIDGRIWENSELAVDLVYLIAVADQKSADILHPERESEAIEIFEQYAATGLAELQKWLESKPDDLLGDEAILYALRKGGFLGTSTSSVEAALSNLSFG